ncbi:hypothetical protein CANINC_000356 [Pichia inconspicua]|uniref:Histone chaperone RTT106 n=1 Tax=Pichia inconspicua TaxID=52247 RepID=A0A4T0X822_9ASCO|nr:hypothetical protein CANINC_000356 [[Candida] inconspicua]
MSEMLDNLPKELQNEMTGIIKKVPESEAVFVKLINYLQNEQTNLARKKTNSEMNKDGLSDVNLEGTNIMLQIPDLSIQSPFRKRLNLVFGAFKGEKKAYLALTKSLDSKPELIIRTLTEENIKFAAILPVPEKKDLRYLFVEYIQNETNSYKNDPILLTFNNDLLQDQFGSILAGKTFVQYLTSQLKLVNFVVEDCTDEYTFFVSAYKGSKEGFLYFLPDHVIFGFKKPILVFKSQDIESISYNSITRLTFNVLLSVKINGIPEKFEFSMIDQKEFENIDKFVKLQQVRDNSMAEEYKAQKQLKNNNEMPGDLAEAAKLVPGGERLISNVNDVVEDNDDDDDENDDNYKVGDSDDDHSDVSDREGHEKDINDEEENDDDEYEDEEYEYNTNAGSSSVAATPSISNLGDLGNFDDNLQQELQDLQKDLSIDINQLKEAGYIE